MPLHDWSRVGSGTYHHFRYFWVASLLTRLNADLLPKPYFALAEQHHTPVVTPKHQLDSAHYARKTSRVAIHHDLGNVVAVIELVSPGNKDTKAALRSFASKSGTMIRKGIHLLVIDPFPPGRYDPEGIHPPVWRYLTDTNYQLPPDKRRSIVSYQAGEEPTAYVEPIALGEPLPDRPLFLTEEYYVNVPLEETYQTTWNGLPVQVRSLLEP